MPTYNVWEIEWTHAPHELYNITCTVYTYHPWLLQYIPYIHSVYIIYVSTWVQSITNLSQNLNCYSLDNNTHSSASVFRHSAVCACFFSLRSECTNDWRIYVVLSVLWKIGVAIWIGLHFCGPIPNWMVLFLSFSSHFKTGCVNFWRLCFHFKVTHKNLNEYNFLWMCVFFRVEWSHYNCY